MEIRGYLRMLRRGWPVILLFAVAGVALAFGYLAAAPKHYQAHTRLFVTTSGAVSANDLQVGLEYSRNVAPTFAEIVDSPEILSRVSSQMRSQRTTSELQQMVSTNAPDSTALIDVTVTGSSANEVTQVADLVATTAVARIPQLVPDGPQGQVSVDLRTVERASRPDSAVSPNPKRVIAIGLIVAAATGLGFSIAQQSLDTRLRRPEDLGPVSSLPLLAVLPRVKRSQRSHVIVRDDPASPAVEAYRSLRTNLAYLESLDHCSLLVTGVGSRADASVPLNLAWSMAQAGRRILLIDLDLRQSTIGDLLRVGVTSGISDLLAGKTDLKHVIHDTSQAGLFVITSGTTQPSPSDLLSNPVMERILRDVEKGYDIVVLHAPPMLAYTDAAVVARVAGQTLMTVHSGRTKAVDLVGAHGALSNVRVNPLGLVLVGTPARRVDLSKVRATWSRSQPSSQVQWDNFDGDGDRDNDGQHRPRLIETSAPRE